MSLCYGIQRTGKRIHSMCPKDVHRNQWKENLKLTNGKIPLWYTKRQPGPKLWEDFGNNHL